MKKKPMTVAQILAVALTPAEALALMKGERTKKKPTAPASFAILTPDEEPARMNELTRGVVAVPKSEAVKPKKRKRRQAAD